MTTVTIELPDNRVDVLATIADIIKNAGGSLEIDNGDLAPRELEMLIEGYKEALAIKEGKQKGIPLCELWHE
jgi:hypothetical protein